MTAVPLSVDTAYHRVQAHTCTSLPDSPPVMESAPVLSGPGGVKSKADRWRGYTGVRCHRTMYPVHDETFSCRPIGRPRFSRGRSSHTL